MNKHILSNKNIEVKISIKTKLLSIYILTILTMIILSIWSNVTLNFSVDKLDTMIESTLQANSIIVETEKIIKGNNDTNNLALIDEYSSSAIFSSKKADMEKDKELINASLKKINNAVSLLSKKYIKNKDSLPTLQTTANLFTSFQDSINLEISAYENSDLNSALVAQTDVLKRGDFFVSSIQQLISLELQYDQQQKEILNRKSAQTGMIVIIAVIIVGVLSMSIAYIFTNRITGTISSLAKASKSIADGNLKVEFVKIKSRDEISILITSFNIMVENLKVLIKKIADSSNKLSHSAEFLKSGAEQNNQAIEQIATTMQQVSYGASDQSQRSQDTLLVVKNMFECNKAAYDNTKKVLYTSYKATNAANDGKQKMENLLKQIGIIEDDVVNTQSFAKTLKIRVGEINKIVDIINHITSQTSLLSLNAAIEAARAGEHGKGFAVVADEISNLANNSSNATIEISNMLKEILMQSENVATSMEIGVSKIKEGIQMASEAGVAFKDIVETSIEVEDQVKEINDEMEKMVEDIGKVKEMSINISEIAKQSSDGSQEVAAAIEEQSASLQEILGSASELTVMANELQYIIDKFEL